MDIHILGPLQVTEDSRNLPITGARNRALLARLASEPETTFGVDALAAAIWPDGAGPDRPTNAVQTVVSRLRRQLPGAVRSVPGGYRLAVPAESVDATRFARLARTGNALLADGQPAQALPYLRDALALWRGDQPLPEVGHAPYAVALTARLTELRLAATEDLIAAELSTGGQLSELVAQLRQLAAAHPLRERAHQLLMEALQAAGSTAEALNVYEQIRGRLAEQLGADPGHALQQAHLTALRGGPRPPTRRTGNLPAELSPLVGRDPDQHDIRHRLREHRLVTLTGAGGAGKTRLARAVAAELAPTLAGGAWLAELAPVSHPDDLPHALLDALHLTAPAHPDPSTDPSRSAATTRLIDALAGAETLLLLDNCEHLLDATARLATTLLQGCPNLRILATSREPLGIIGEALAPVPPLPLPHLGADPAEIAGSAAVRLFTARAVAVRPDFALTAGNAATIAAICRRLDGLPLAIELAAARLRHLDLEHLDAGLADRFDLLTGGSRTGPERHRTLRAVVDWSWQLLDDEQRRVARRLAVFPDTITVPTARHVCERDSSRVEAVLSALVDRSWLTLAPPTVPAATGPGYRMLETIRQYATERLTEAEEHEQARSRHTGWCVELAEQAAPWLRGAGQLPWLAKLRTHHSDLLAAYGHGLEAGQADTVWRLARALGYFWTVHGDHAAAARRLQSALAQTAPAGGDAGRGEVAALFLFNSLLTGGEAAEAVAQVRQFVPTAGTEPVDAGTAMLRAILALADDQLRSGLEAVDCGLADPDPWTRGMLWLLRSWLHGNAGEVPELLAGVDAAVAQFRVAGERWGLSLALTHRAHVQVLCGDLDGAVEGLNEALGLARELGVYEDATLQRVVLAGVRAQRGERERARAELMALVGPDGGVRSARDLSLAWLALGDLARREADFQAAAGHYRAAWQQLRRVPWDTSLYRAMLLCAEGHLAVSTGATRRAAELLEEAWGRAVEVPDMPLAADVAVAIGRLTAASDPGVATTVLGAAHAVRGTPDTGDPDVRELVDVLRAALGDDQFEAGYASGRELPRPEALALIRAQARRR